MPGLDFLKNHRVFFAAVFIMLVGAWLRLYQLGEQSLWLDELFSVLVAQRPLSDLLTASAQGDTNPPLFNVLLHFVLKLGDGETVVRSLSAAFSIATIPLFYITAVALFNYRVALVATFILAINPLHILFAQEARMYAQLTFFALASVYFFWRAIDQQKRLDWFFYVMFALLTLYSHSLGFLTIAALGCFFLVCYFGKSERNVWQPFVLAHFAVAVGFLPWVWWFVGQLTRVSSGFWATSPTFLAPLFTFYLFMVGVNVGAMLTAVALFSLLALLIFSMLSIWKKRYDVDLSQKAILLILLLSFGPSFFLLLLSHVQPIYVDRTLLPASLGLYLLLAWTVVMAKPKLLNGLFLISLLGIGVYSTTVYFSRPEAQKPPLRETAAYISQHFQPGDIIIHTSDTSAQGFLYYAPSLPSGFLAGDPDYERETTRGQTGRIVGLKPQSLTTLIADHNRLWLVVALDHNIEYQRSQVAWINRQFEKESEVNIGGINILRFSIP